MAEYVQKYDIAVIGAGPAGIMAAIFAAKNGAKVVLIEKNDKIGRKILATGNGRCNLTNKNIDINRYHSQNVKFAEPIFASFDQFETMKFFENLGLIIKEEDHGRIFPSTNQASSVVNALLAELEKLGIQIRTNFIVKKIEKTFSWEIFNDTDKKIIAKRVILTTGGRAAHQFGSSGDGLFWAKNFGHTIIPIHAALVPIEVTEPWVKELMGIKLTSRVRLIANDKTILERKGDLIFTHFGISGPAVMGLAREVDPLQKVKVSIDLLPGMSKEKLDSLIESQIKTNNKKLISSIITGFLPKNIVPRVLLLADVADRKAAELSKIDRRNIVNTLKDFQLSVNKVRPLKEAQVTAGGISTTEIRETLESKLVPGLYFAGEILDIDGDSGGFNLQWAWSSGKVAGENAVKG
jgi:predicted Rossmann fold flavoprotein